MATMAKILGKPLIPTRDLQPRHDTVNNSFVTAILNSGMTVALSYIKQRIVH
jgi:hypothetical protein